MSKSKKQNDRTVDEGVIELDGEGKVITDAAALEGARADEIEAHFAAKVAKAGGFISYSEVLATGIPVSAMIERGWENVPDMSGIRKVKANAASTDSTE